MKPLTGMKRTSCFALLLAPIATACLVAGCSGNGSPVESLALPGGATQAQMPFRNALARTGNALVRVRPGTVTPPGDVAVSEFTDKAIDILDSSLNKEGNIGPLPSNPTALWYDNAENLYVVEPYAAQVEEFPDGAHTPSFTYSFPLTQPTGVTTNSNRTVFIADAQKVFAYPQAGKHPFTGCDTGLQNTGVAVDFSGDVFVSGNGSFPVGNIVAFVSGLSGCNPMKVGATLQFPTGGLAVDGFKRLAAVDALGVEVLNPPYNYISSTCGARYTRAPHFVSFNRTQSLLFVSDTDDNYINVVWVLNWPACTLYDVIVLRFTGLMGGVAASINPGE